MTAKYRDRMGSIARCRPIVGVFVVAALVPPLVASAAPVTPINPTPPPPTVTGTSPPPPAPLPDVVVTDISIDAECRVVAHLANAGGAPIPPHITEFTLSFGGVVNGQWKLSADKLRAPGATMTYSLPTPKVVGSQTQKVSLTSTGSFTEASTTNNRRTEMLTCSPKFADIALKVTTKPDCSRTIEVSNVGDAGLFPSAWTIPLERAIDGRTYAPVMLQAIDPTHLLAAPGGKVLYNEPLTPFRAYEKASYSISYPFQEKGDNKANNTANVTMPQPCRGTPPPMDVAVTNVRIDDSCRLQATVKNTGTTSLPALALRTAFYQNGTFAGTWTADLSRAAAPGAEMTVSGPFVKETAPQQIKVVLDHSNTVSETREDNNTVTRTLQCGGSTPTPRVIPPRVLAPPKTLSR